MGLELEPLGTVTNTFECAYAQAHTAPFPLLFSGAHGFTEGSCTPLIGQKSAGTGTPQHKRVLPSWAPLSGRQESPFHPRDPVGYCAVPDSVHSEPQTMSARPYPQTQSPSVRYANSQEGGKSSWTVRRHQGPLRPAVTTRTQEQAAGRGCSAEGAGQGGQPGLGPAGQAEWVAQHADSPGPSS